ncbi:hypothetical protein Tsubulata_006658 [Turnera subulata]|uniref:Uncharacterized protein n=1 Tax=Turnera subulata TaxID=218843 RepID=A0A9Q0JAA8_9ROSI|nr:hypothetical protein Tsubulata_006658 [Turnera subulata]
MELLTSLQLKPASYPSLKPQKHQEWILMTTKNKKLTQQQQASSHTSQLHCPHHLLLIIQPPEQLHMLWLLLHGIQGGNDGSLGHKQSVQLISNSFQCIYSIILCNFFSLRGLLLFGTYCFMHLHPFLFGINDKGLHTLHQFLYGVTLPDMLSFTSSCRRISLLSRSCRSRISVEGGSSLIFINVFI